MAATKGVTLLVLLLYCGQGAELPPTSVTSERPQRPQGSSGRVPGCGLCSGLQPWQTPGWPDPEDSSGRVPGCGLCSGLHPQRTPGWPDPEARKGAALGPASAEVTVLIPRMEQSTPAELHGEPVRGQDARCADTGQAASSPRGHRAGGPRTAEETPADRQPP
ncbi:unnamed protein product [Rangifer tarandus platyrhynchus]|uniref:Uncharacterized protein n=1 Tax=Rangifer tarandus platyrhynchus TaxID=3082113 RepID=A0ABN9A139_RANTA|nr:unnamed protein product [Rangifer tarandus platyrhynchus]